MMSQINNYEYQGEFLNQFDSGKRSLVTNQFCHAVRAGCDNQVRVRLWVRNDAAKRLHDLRLNNNTARAATSATASYSDDVGRATQEALLGALDSAEAIAFAEFILNRESLPWEERQRLKAERGEAYQRQWMEGQPATPKQLAYLRSLGCRTTPKSKAEASILIGQYKR